MNKYAQIYIGTQLKTLEKIAYNSEGAPIQPRHVEDGQQFGGIMGAVNAYQNAVGDLTTWGVGAADRAGDAIGREAAAAGRAVDQGRRATSNAAQTVGDYARATGDVLGQNFRNNTRDAANAVTGAAQAAGKGVSDAAQTAGNWLSNAYNSAKGAVTSAAQTAGDYAGATASVLGQNFKNNTRDAADAVARGGRAIQEGYDNATTRVGQGLNTAQRYVGGLGDALSGNNYEGAKEEGMQNNVDRARGMRERAGK